MRSSVPVRLSRAQNLDGHLKSRLGAQFQDAEAGPSSPLRGSGAGLDASPESSCDLVCLPAEPPQLRSLVAGGARARQHSNTPRWAQATLYRNSCPGERLGPAPSQFLYTMPSVPAFDASVLPDCIDFRPWRITCESGHSRIGTRSGWKERLLTGIASPNRKRGDIPDGKPCWTVAWEGPTNAHSRINSPWEQNTYTAPHPSGRAPRDGCRAGCSSLPVALESFRSALGLNVLASDSEVS